MSKEELTVILRDLRALSDNLYVAKITKDRRSLAKKVHKAEEDIREYANCIPSELRMIFEKKIGSNVLFGQHM